jgi:type II secretory pathway pseudopilin PulG
VGDSDRVEHRPAAGSGGGPCGRTLFYTVNTLHRVGAYVLALEASGRTMSLLSQDMNLLDEWSFPRGGVRALTHPASSTMLTLRAGTWTWIDVHALVTQRRPDLERYVIEPLESKTFYGQQTHVLSYGQPTTPTKIRAVVLPVIEGAQTFSSPNLAGFTAYVQRAVAPTVRNYYMENSFSALTDVTVDVFGGNVGPAGGPLKLPRGKVADYYFPDYDPARLELTRTGLAGTETIELDGRESLVVWATPLTGGGDGKTLTVPFFALGLRLDVDLYPVQVKFLGTEKLTLDVTLPSGTAKKLTLTFPAKTIDIADDTQIAAKLADLATYLDSVMAAAETADGITPRLFAGPKTTRVPAIGKQFGSLIVTFARAATVGAKLKVTKATATLPGGDPLALSSPLLGVIPVNDVAAIDAYLDVATLLAQEAAGAGYNARLLNPPTVTLSAGVLTTRIPISDRFGGPGAAVTLTSTTDLSSLFTASAAVPNSATTKNQANGLRDRSQLYQDAFSAAIQRIRDAGRPLDAFKDYTVILVLPVEPAVPNPADPAAVLSSEAWAVTALDRPFDFRGAEDVTTVADKVDQKVQAQSAWSLIFMPGGKPDTPMIVHEIGHALGYSDLYFQNGYRDELAYLGGWAMMDSHWDMPHHCGYHKLQSRWIPEGAGTEKDYGRVYPLGPPAPAQVRNWEFLLVPLELWRDSLVGSARAAFGAGPATPVVQLGWIDFGGDGATFGLIEARQAGAMFSRHLPDPGGGVLITNCISWTLDQRFATNGWYRRSVQWLNPSNVLRNAGDSFDLAHAAELAVKGMTVEVLDTRVVEGDAHVYRVKVTRQNAEFVDLYFESPPIYYKNPDLWIDWQGNNKPTATDLVPGYGLGQPTDQGEAIRVPSKDTEPHWVVARLRNRGQVKALDVKLNFFYFKPPGAGDGQKPMDVNKLSAYQLIGSTTFPQVPGGNTPQLVLRRWDVPAGFGGHTCLLVQIEDYKIPEDSTGAVLGSDDVWVANNHAQKNVDTYEAATHSPFSPIEFDFSVRNEGVTPEIAYLEPDALPYGMTLTVTPPVRTIPAASTVTFRCRLELDDAIIEAGCQNDQRFRIHAWRRDAESTARWGGVEYEIRPRQGTHVTLAGTWDGVNTVQFTGTVTPDPGGGTVMVRLEFAGHQATWVKTPLGGGGVFAWSGTAPSDSFTADAVGWFEGNRTFGSARSLPAHVEHPPIIR